jgi:hypothetical protein
VGIVTGTLLDWLKEAAEPVVVIPSVIALFTGGGVGAWIGHHVWPSDSPSNPKASVSIGQPVDAESVPPCILTTGSAYVPAGDSVWIVIESFNPTGFYPLAAADITSAAQSGNVTWSYKASVGGATDTGASFKIYAVILDKPVSQYLSSTTVVDSAGKANSLAEENASAPELPPDSQAQDSKTVTRTSGAQNC